MLRHRAARSVAVLLLAALTTACGRYAPAAITAAELEAHVRELASDALGGRLTGSPEIARAEDYIAHAFRTAGLSPIDGAAGYFVDYTAWRAGYDAAATTLVVRHRGSDVATGSLGVDFRPFDFSAAGSATGEVVFAGYGITAPEYGWDDYRGLDVRGRIVLILRYEPNENDPQSPFAGARHTAHATFVNKMRNARAHGAVGMLLFTTPLAHAPEEDLRADAAWRLRPEELSAAPAESGSPGFLALHISQGLADRMASAAGASIRELQREVDGGKSPAELGIRGLEATLRVGRAGAPEPVAARNVVGVLRGRRPEEGVVVVGAHHDHIGSFDASGAADTVYNGADDNASGVAALLELAQAFGRARQRPDRTLVFATFSGEEQYLLGSAALLESGLLPPGRVAFMLNLDMVGRNPGGELMAYGADAELRAAVETAAGGLGLTLSFPARIGDSLDSDQSVFAARGIPSLFLHTGLHEDYHGLDDEADRIDYERLRLVASLARLIVRDRARVVPRPTG